MTTPADTAPTAPVPVHVPERARFEVGSPEGTSVLTYTLGEGVVSLDHTVVPPEVTTRGTGTALVRSALAWAAQEHLAVVPRCPFVQSFVARHPDQVHVELRPV
jgi:predicted GNAT family acetyltransferase